MAGLSVMALAAMFASHAGAAEETMIHLPTREGVVQPFFLVKRDHASATVVLMTGGKGVIGLPDASGWPGSSNFLIRSAKLFAAAGFNVAMPGRPSDVQDLDDSIRTSARHMKDLHALLEYLKSQSDAPIWVVGTSLGTVSTASLAIVEGDNKLLSGIVLTSSMTNYRMIGAVPRQDLERIKVPVLVLHHEKDACLWSQASQLEYIMKGLRNSRAAAQITVSNGAGARGDPCEPMHFHGYIGMEQEAVDIIADWIRKH